MGHPPRIPVWLPPEQEVVYFVTLCVKDRHPGLANDRALMALRSAVERLEHWWVYAAILMPDHVHVLAVPDDREAAVGNLSGALKRWIRQGMVTPETTAGGAPALQRNAETGIVGQPPRLPSMVPPNWEWQPGSFDRLLRSEESAQAKREYMRENPVRAGLVQQWTDWPYSVGFRQRQTL